ncbi:MAG: ABC transporter substrate-binding protein, partial [Pseudolabrys sp.]
LIARAQQSEPMRRIGMLMNRAAESAEGQARVAAFTQSLHQLGWTDGRDVTHVAVLRDPSNPSGSAEFAAIQALAQSLKIDVSPVDTRRDAGEIERAITTFARTANGGLIVTPNASASVHRDLIVALAARHRLPAVYPFRYHADGGGLVSYGPDVVDQCRRAAGYVDRILKGEKPADLPVQAPTKYEMVINLKTAKALGLTLSESLIARADEVIE